MTVAIYIRVSTEEQAAEGYSISAQKEKLKAYCNAQDWEDFKFYVDEGRSAKDLKRPLLQEMLSHIKKGLIDTVLVYRLDRLTRSVVDLHNLLSLFDEHDCSFKSATEVYDTSSAMGRFFITIISSVAQFERENTSERVSFAMAEKARLGEYVPSAPFGFDKGKEGKLIINEKEKEIYLDIVDKILRGYSLRQTCAYLDSIGVKTRRSTDMWKVTTLRWILNNTAAYGAITWNHQIYEDSHEAIIDKVTYEKVQKIIKLRNYSRTTRRGHTDHIFKSKLLCPVCSRRLTGSRTKYLPKNADEAIYNNNYRCNTCKEHNRPVIQISERKIEKAFMEYLSNYRINKAKINRTAINSNEKEKEKILRELVALREERSKWQKAWAASLISDDEFSKLMKDTQSKVNDAERRQQKIKTSVITSPEEIKKMNFILKELKRNWKHLDTNEKIDFVNMFIENIEFQKEPETKVLKISFL